MPYGRVRRVKRRLGLVALLLVAFAYLFMGQDDNGGHRAHYALVKSLAAGTAIVDDTMYQVGDVPPSDVVVYEGHFYSNKPPGLALLTLPLYLALDAAGVRTTGDPSRMIWALGLLGNVAPAVILLLLIRYQSERLEPGLGVITAVTVGLATLLLPFASTLYSHVLVATLLFAAFVVLWRERERGPQLRLVAAAGVLAGLAVTAEYPSALGALVLGLYALARPRVGLGGVLGRTLAYAAGALAGVVPLAVYDWWAFGSPFHLSYFGDPPPGGSEFGTVEGGIGPPSFRVAVELLLSQWGLLVATPVLAAGVIGLVLFYRRGFRAEVAVIGSMSLLYLTLNASLAWPFGGTTGTRYLITLVPFLGLMLVGTYRAAPLVTVSLAGISAAVMTIISATKPLIAWDGQVFARLFNQDGSAETLSDVLGVTGWYDVLPFYAVILAAIVAAVVATDLQITRRELPAVAVAVTGWLSIVLITREVLGHPPAGVLGASLVLCVAVVIVALVAAVSTLSLQSRRRLLPQSIGGDGARAAGRGT